METNILITSLSKKIPLIKALKKAFEDLKIVGKVVGGDTNQITIGRYFVDDFWEMPPLSALSLSQFINECHKRKILAVIPTRNGELKFFAEHKEKLKAEQISVMISPLETIETCLDKLKFYDRLKDYNFPVVPTTEHIDSLNVSRYVVKERFGAGAKGVGLNMTHSEAVQHALTLEHPIFQPYIRGFELSVDVYTDLEGKSKGAIARTRDLVVEGESQITTSASLPALESQCALVSEHLKGYGHLIFQVIHDASGIFHLIECNPRFGGASSLAVSMGLLTFNWFLLETLNQKTPPFIRSKTEQRQVRFPEDRLFPF